MLYATGPVRPVAAFSGRNFRTWRWLEMCSAPQRNFVSDFYVDCYVDCYVDFPGRSPVHPLIAMYALPLR